MLAIDQIEGEYNGVWHNLQLLLNLPPSPRILIIGSRFFSGMSWLPHADYHDSLDIGKKDSQYDFILLHTLVAKSKKALSSFMNHAEKMISPHGALMVFAMNFYSLSNKNVINPAPGRIFKYIKLGYNGYHNLFKAVGPAVQYDFLPMPSLFSSEEYVRVGSNLVEVPYYSSILNRLAHRFERYHLFHDGFVFLKVNECLEDNELFARIEKSVLSYLRINETKLLLERLDTRLRGATIIHLRDQTTNTPFIVRIVSDKNAQSIVEKNHSFLSAMWSSDKICNSLKRVLPQPVDQFTYKNAHIYIETKIPGVLAWKVNKKSFRDKIYRNSVDFLTKLQSKTKKTFFLDDLCIQQLFNDDQQRILAVAGFRKDKINNSLARVIHAIKDNIEGREMYLSVAHGDYGYGNIMINPLNAELTGVIDWDTGKQFDFPCVDIINLQVQKARSEEGLGLAEAFIKVGEKVIKRGFIDDGIYTREFGMNSELIKISVLISIIRFMGRAAQYAAIFNRDFNEFLELMEYVSSKWIDLKT